MKTERTARLERAAVERGRRNVPVYFIDDYHRAARTLLSHLEPWERAARAMEYAFRRLEIYVDPEDRLGGRMYHMNEQPVTAFDPALDCETDAAAAFAAAFPEAAELEAYQLIGGTAKGHITWFFHRVLTEGISGMRRRFTDALETAKDEAAAQFYKGVLIMLDVLMEFNDRHIEAYEKLGNFELADRMRRVPLHPAETFRDAVQSFYMQHIVVMRENPYGGNGPGRLDYYLWPYLERDLEAGRCTLEEAREIIDELFLRIDERLYGIDAWVEAIVVGGTRPDGSSAVNPLTYIMVESVMALDTVHPAVYIRLPEDPPEALVSLAARYMVSGRNRAQILYDPPILAALIDRGTPFEDAVEYACGGCMEVGVQGMTSDFLYIGWQNTAKMLELMITGGVCLRTGKRVPAFRANRGLASYGDFESFYGDFIAEARRLTEIYLKKQDIYSAYAEKARPSYLISSMIDDCFEKGRNMHGGGARYHDYGGTHLALPNTADALYAIKYAVFDRKLCTAETLTAALKADFKGYEALQAKLRAIPKYGVDDENADALAARVFGDFADMYLNYTTRWGGRGKPVILTFQYAPAAASVLGATADGRNAGKLIAQGVTPHSASMTEGITAAMNSCGRLPHGKFAGGASTMWDLDSAWASESLVTALIRTFCDKNCQIFQGNTTPLRELLDAVEHPEEHQNLIVRVGGYSARFVNLTKELQNDVICRLRHSS
ncbi:MAG: hypothetical protein J6C51_08635 [Clostridia bacterium]|nr:hypothetical protein [Clostridia bacterium]